MFLFGSKNMSKPPFICIKLVIFVATNAIVLLFFDYPSADTNLSNCCSLLLYILALSVNLSICLHLFTNMRRSLWQALIWPIMWPLHLKRTWQLDGRTKSTLKERIPGNEQFQYNASVSSICPTPSQVLEAVIGLTQQYV